MQFLRVFEEMMESIDGNQDYFKQSFGNLIILS